MSEKKELDISAMPTPNPNAIKFLINLSLLEKGSITFNHESDLSTSPLAKQLLAIKGLDQVMVGSNFISINKEENTGWETVLESASNTIRQVLESEENAIDPASIQKAHEQTTDDRQEVQVIKQILDDEIRPAIAQDGGDCQFHSYEDGILTLQLQGACSTCPSSVMTLKMGIESRLKEAVPDLQEVVQL
eukprot:COSAG01_NODE_740_length_13891_cov_35.573013_3_plen_190_part_00